MVSTLKRSHATTPRVWSRRKEDQLGPSRRGAGPRPAYPNRRCTVLGEIRMPRRRNSPTMRREPQRGVSRARRNTSSRVSTLAGGRPNFA